MSDSLGKAIDALEELGYDVRERRAALITLGELVARSMEQAIDDITPRSLTQLASRVFNAHTRGCPECDPPAIHCRIGDALDATVSNSAAAALLEEADR